MVEYKGYELLLNHLLMAYEQAAVGKGKERHAEDNVPFEEQPICSIGRHQGSFDFNTGQAVKKAIESKRIYKIMGAEAAKKELYGAINYLVGACVLIDEGE